MSEHPLLRGVRGERHLLLGNEAIVRGALEAGVHMVSCYPGTPSSEVPDTFHALGGEGRYRMEYSVNEKVALEVAAGAALAGAMSLVTMKHVGLNVAADPLFTCVYTGLPGGMVVGGFFSSRVTIRRLDPAGVAESGIVPVFGSVKASDAGEVLTPGGVVLIESAAPRSTVTTDISSLREDGVEDIFFRYEDTMTHYSVDKMADAAGEDADVELKQNREDISLRLDGETRDDLSEGYQEWVPVWIPEVKERLILTHEHEEVERKTSEELRRELDELLKQERDMMDFQLAKKKDDRPSLDWWLEPARAETVEQKTSEELRRERDELLKQELDMMDFQLAKKRDDLPSLDWWLEPARAETPRIGLEESLKQLASRFEAIAPEEDKPRLFLLETTVPDGTKYTNLLESDLRSYADLGDDWDDLPDTQGEIKIWLPEDLEHLISPSKESLSRIDGIA